MKKWKAICLIVTLIFVLQALIAPAKAISDDTAVHSGCHSVDAQKPLMPGDQMLETSKAVIVYERKSDTLVYAYNADGKIYPASMVKLMTALVALEHGNLTDVVTVTRSALNEVAIGSVSAGLKSGEEITLEALLYCMMTASANDASVVIAHHISGSQQEFVTLMNEKAAQLGCTGTHFSNVHGLHDEDTYTTVRDVCRILDVALDNETFRTMFETKKYTVPATNKSEERTVLTTNYMMSKEPNARYFDERVTGGKTGATDKAGRCLALTAQANDMDLIAIVMGAEPTYEVDGIILKTHGSYEEMAVLLDNVFSGFEYRQIASTQQALRQFPVTEGSSNVVAAPGEDLGAVLPIDSDGTMLSWVYGDMTASTHAPVAAGQNLGSLQVWYGDICIANTDLVAMHSVSLRQPPVDASRGSAAEDGDDGAIVGIVIGVLIALIVVGLAGYWGIMTLRRAAARRRRMRRRKEQRRRY